MKNFALLVLIGLIASSLTHAIDNGLGRLPPLAWNTWCTDGPCGSDFCNEAEIVQIADAMVANGMRDLGYKYINLDDCWAGPRLPNGTITADSTRFPNGLKPLIDYVHSQGMLFGVYTCAGKLTCVGGRPGSYGYYSQDAQSYKEWGVDYVKMDWCNTLGLSPRVQYPEFAQALNATGRAIYFGICEWGVDDPWLWAASAGNQWRISADRHDVWYGINGLPDRVDKSAGLSKYAGPGGWNDLDLLTTCLGGQTFVEYVSEFSLWSILNSPLIVSTDVRNMTDCKRTILLNKEVIDVNQDPMGVQGDRVFNDPVLGHQVWTKPMSDGSKAIVLFNNGIKDVNVTAKITVEWSWLAWGDSSVALVRDLWQHKDLGNFKGSFTAEVEYHGVVMLRVWPTPNPPSSSSPRKLNKNNQKLRSLN